jgi:hypothetical protein
LADFFGWDDFSDLLFISLPLGCASLGVVVFFLVWSDLAAGVFCGRAFYRAPPLSSGRERALLVSM